MRTPTGAPSGAAGSGTFKLASTTGTATAGTPRGATAPEAAAFLRVDESELLSAAVEGELPGRAIGDEWRFSRAALLAWLRGEQGESRAAA